MAAVNRLFTEVFAAGKVQAADEILTPDFRFQYPFPGFSPGMEGIAEFTKAFHGGFPGFELDVNELYGGAVRRSSDPAPKTCASAFVGRSAAPTKAASGCEADEQIRDVLGHRRLPARGRRASTGKQARGRMARNGLARPAATPAESSGRWPSCFQGFAIAIDRNGGCDAAHHAAQGFT